MFVKLEFGSESNVMKKLVLVLVCSVCVGQVPDDAITVSSTIRTVTEVKTREWRRIQFNADPATGDVSVSAIYEEVLRVDGKPVGFTEIRTVSIPWSQATNIAPALVLVREQFKAAMPLILTNTP